MEADTMCVNLAKTYLEIPHAKTQRRRERKDSDVFLGELCVSASFCEIKFGVKLSRRVKHEE
jgi:hypothetical protein